MLSRLADCLAPPAGEPFSRRAVIDLLAAGPLRHSGEAGGDRACGWTRPGRRASWPAPTSGRRAWRTDDAASSAGSRGSRRAARRQWTTKTRSPARSRRCVSGSRQWAACWGPSGSWCKRAGLRRSVASGAVGRTSSRAWQRRCSTLRRRWRPVTPRHGCRGSRCSARRSTSRRPPPCSASRWPGLVCPSVAWGVTAWRSSRRSRCAGSGFHTVVFTGLAEGGFPSRGRPDPLLGDAERRRIAQALGVRLPLSEQRDAESLLLFAFACEAARDRLVLLAPRSGAADGRPRLPSRLLLRLASRAAGRPVGLDEFLGGEALQPVWRRLAGSPAFSDDVVWVNERERDVALLLALGAAGRRGAASSYAAAVLGDEDAAGRRFAAWRSSRSPVPGAWDGLFGAEARAALAATHPFDAEMHPTRLERFVSCPFSFLLRDLYGLQAPDEPGDSLEMDALEFGTLAHDILQRAYQAVIDEDLRRDEAQAAVVAAWRECCAEAEARGVTGAALSWEVRRELLLEDLLETVRRDPVFEDPDGRPVGVEWRFGEAVGRPVTLELPGGRSVRFAGRLDRVDATAAGARVIDYKSGGGGTERNRIKERLSVQLPVYRLALRQTGDEQYASIACLYRLITRRGGFEDLDLPEDEEASSRRLGELVAGAAALVDAGHVPAHHPPALRVLRRALRVRCVRLGAGPQTRARRARRRGRAPVGSTRGARRCLSDPSATPTSGSWSPPTSAPASCSRQVRGPARPVSWSTATSTACSTHTEARATSARWPPSRSPRRRPESCGSACARSSSGWPWRPQTIRLAPRSSTRRSTRSTTRPSAPSTASPAGCCGSSRWRPASTRRSSSSTSSGRTSSAPGTGTSGSPSSPPATPTRTRRAGGSPACCAPACGWSGSASSR